MKKVLLATLDFYPAVGGVSYYWMQLAKHLPGHELIVLAPPLPKGTTELQTKYRIIRKPFLSRVTNPKWFPLLVNLWSIIRREKPNVVIVGQVLPVGTAVWFLSYLTKLQYIVSCHGMDVMLTHRNWIKQRLAKAIFRRARHIIVNSDYTAAAVAQYGIASDRISKVYPCPVRIPDASFKKSTTSGHTILTVARLVKRKGHEYILNALPEVISKYPDTQYIIAGDGPYKKTLEDRITSLGLQSHVRILSGLSDEQISEQFKAADVFAMTPIDLNGDVEGFGIVYLEAAAFSLPSIASSTGGTTEAVLDGKTGILVPAGNSDAIIKALIRLFSDTSYAHLLGEQGNDRVHQQFQWRIQATALSRIIDTHIL